MQIQKLSQYIFIPPFLLLVFFEYEFAIQKLSSLGHLESFVEIESLLYAVRLPLYVVMFALWKATVFLVQSGKSH